MKLVIVTAVEEFQKDVLRLFQKANIENLSTTQINGLKNIPTEIASNWFSAGKTANESTLFFSFTDDEQIATLFNLIEEFNKSMETDNPLKAVVVPIEKFI
ncbi:hypothetical protein KCTC32516_00876 [Polaribacter huanghezhanensis]|uniref:hypothetical protein n=1 Tax=Polaribacter huanghezhanensis TaxID=1354726 RepID=UPI00264989F8|nr:hypothetical protein [Polaribacter huanghezhanensis]WKD85535.1 hypothetical protein KCTC32516_00876 [Polaribacter huanghezhanensis]